MKRLLEIVEKLPCKFIENLIPDGLPYFVNRNEMKRSEGE